MGWPRVGGLDLESPTSEYWTRISQPVRHSVSYSTAYDERLTLAFIPRGRANSLPKTLTQAHLHELSITFKDALREASLRRFREQKTHGPDVRPELFMLSSPLTKSMRLLIRRLSSLSWRRTTYASATARLFSFRLSSLVPPQQPARPGDFARRKNSERLALTAGAARSVSGVTSGHRQQFSRSCQLAGM